MVDGNSPKSDRYSLAKRLNCQKPCRVAISVTVVAVGALSRKGPPRQVHAVQQQISLGAHPQLLLAAQPQCPVRHSDRLAKLRDVKRFIGIFLHCPAKPAHDGRVVPQRRIVLADFPLPEAANQGFDQRLLETARRLGVSDDFGSIFRQLPGCRVQPLKSRHREGGRRDRHRIARRRQVASSQCVPDNRRILDRQRHGAPAGRPGGTLKSAFALAVPHNVGREHLRTAPEQAWPRLGAERDDGAPALGGRMSNALQVVGETLRPQAMQIDPQNPLLRQIPTRGCLAFFFAKPWPEALAELQGCYRTKFVRTERVPLFNFGRNAPKSPRGRAPNPSRRERRSAPGAHIHRP